MLKAAIASDDPVVVLESRALYPRKGPVQTSETVDPLGGARVLRSGDAATIVSWGRTVHDCLAAADALEDDGVSVEVIDLRWINPLDIETVLTSIQKTNRLLVAHEANLTSGFGAEVVARVSEEGFWTLDGPVVRVGAPDIRVPAAPSLQQHLLVSPDSIVAGVTRLLGGSRSDAGH
jgi:pyruvate dehydrogenase E1 component beta subunit/2-oxoisovalerate dehydrogenase E1 component